MQQIRFGIFSFVLAGTALCYAGPWTTYQGNNAHTGYSSGSHSASNFSVAWDRMFTAGADLPFHQVVAGDGRVFASQRGYYGTQTFFALNAATGATDWSVSFVNRSSLNAPAFANGSVYFQTGNHATDTFMHSYTSAGAWRWRTPHLAQWEQYLAPVVDGGGVYANTGYYGGMTRFNEGTGATAWATTALPQYDRWSPALNATHALTYLGSDTPGFLPGVYAIDRATSATTYRIDDPGYSWDGYSMNGALLLGVNNDAFAVQGGRLIRFDLSSRTIGWQMSQFYSGQPALAGIQLFAIQGGTLAVLDSVTGSYLWGFADPNASFEGAMLVTDSHVFLQTDERTLSVNRLTRQEDWSIGITGQMSFTNDTLYLAGTGRITAINAVPEPASLAALPAAVLLLRRWRSRRT